VDNFELYPTSLWKNKLWMYDFEPGNKSIRFITVDAATAKTDTIYIDVPSSFQELFIDPYKIALAVNDSFCVLGCDKKLAVFRRTANGKTGYLKALDIGTETEYLHLQGSRLLVGRLLTARQRKDETFLGVYDLIDEKWIKTIDPAFKLVEFSQTYPHSWMNVTDSSILITQTRDYEISIYDYSLKEAATLTRNVPGWRSITDRELEKMDRLKPDQAAYGQYVLDSIFTQRSYINYIVTAKFMTDTSIAVCYLPYSKERSQDDARPYLFDVWVKDKGQWKLKYADMKDEPGKDEEMTTKQSFPFNAYRDMIDYHFTGSRIICLRMGGRTNVLSKPYSTIMDNIRACFVGQNPGAAVYIYSVK
jgi:hypothetical protein